MTEMKYSYDYIVPAKVEVFVVPNRAAMVGEFLDCQQEGISNLMSTICDMKGMTFDPENDRMAELWFVSEKDLESENLRSHGLNINIDGNWYSSFLPCSYLPVKLFEGHKEGDSMQLYYPVTVKDCDGNEISVLINMDLKLTQLTSRYYHRGNFEDALEYVQC